jgi:hypothetical protein
LHAALAEAFTPPPPADFDAWQRQHFQAVAHLNPERVKAFMRRRRMMSRTAVFCVTGTVLICVWLGLTHFSPDSPANSAFAQTLDQIQKAKAVTWNLTYYERITSKDKKRTWLRPDTRQWSYESPGLYREVKLDEKGQIKWVTITDARCKQQVQLTLRPGEKKAFLCELAIEERDPLGPFEWVKKELQDANLQFVETRKTARGAVSVFRHSMRDNANGRDWSYDFWIAQETKQLVEVRIPGSDIFNPETEPDRNNPPEKRWSTGTAPGYIERDIVLDAKLDDSLFSLEPPRGYAFEVKHRAQVTEKEMIDYLGVMADYNDRTFPDQPFGLPSDRTSKSWAKPKKDRTAAEQKLLDTVDHYLRANLFSLPTGHFVREHTVEKSFRYIGKGVKLGDKNRIVCWYKLKDAKNASTYRVVYGDLSVKDVAAKDLPLPVGP